MLSHRRTAEAARERDRMHIIARFARMINETTRRYICAINRVAAARLPYWCGTRQDTRNSNAASSVRILCRRGSAYICVPGRFACCMCSKLYPVSGVLYMCTGCRKDFAKMDARQLRCVTMGLAFTCGFGVV